MVAPSAVPLRSMAGTELAIAAPSTPFCGLPETIAHATAVPVSLHADQRRRRPPSVGRRHQRGGAPATVLIDFGRH